MSLFTSNVNRWEEFWQHQTSPLHRNNDSNWYCLYAEELNTIFKSVGYSSGAVLELGCGNGGLYPYLNIDKDAYLGVDISESLLTLFQEKHPSVRLIKGNAADFYEDKKYELIFGNGVVQYLTKPQVRQCVKNSLRMLDRSGVLVLANIPWKQQRWPAYSGELAKKLDYRPHLIFKYFASRVLRRADPIGYWYSPRDFAEFEALGYSVVIYGSLFHPYRFSVSLKKTN